MRPLRPFVAAAVALTLIGCGLRGNSEPAAPPAGTSAETAGVDLDGTDTVEEFQRDVDGATSIAERYWQAKLAESGVRFEPVRQVVAYQRDGEVDCGGQPLPRNNAAYCSAGDFIAYDVNWAFVAFEQIGDAFLFFLLGHEYAHAIQARLGVQAQFTIQQELQADCMAGAYIGDATRTKPKPMLTLQDGDLDELRDGLAAVADDPGQPWFAEGSHGTAEQRTAAFANGFRDSLQPCGLT
jgi:predicted metalloprotease